MTAVDTRMARKVLRDPVNLVAFGFGTGLSPVAPGTVGTVLGVVLAWAVQPLAVALQIARKAFVIGAAVNWCSVPMIDLRYKANVSRFTWMRRHR